MMRVLPVSVGTINTGKVACVRRVWSCRCSQTLKVSSSKASNRPGCEAARRDGRGDNSNAKRHQSVVDTVLLHIEKKNRRESLAQALNEEYEVISGDPTTEEADGNLLILDYSTFQRNGPSAIETFKERDPHVVRPVLLLVPSDWMSHLPSETWNQIDDLIDVPFRLPELKGRVRVLLQWHQSSAEARRYMNLVKGARGQAATYKGLFADHPCGVFLVKDGEIEEVNRRAEQLFDSTAEELKGRTLAELSPEGENPIGERAGPFPGPEDENDPQAAWQFERSGGEIFEARLSVGLVTIGDETFVEVVIYEPSL